METQTRQYKYAALITESRTIPGDERSRISPGHGYPEHTIETTRLKKFANVEEMRKYVDREESSKYGKDNYTLIEYREMIVNRVIKLDIE